MEMHEMDRLLNEADAIEERIKDALRAIESAKHRTMFLHFVEKRTNWLRAVKHDGFQTNAQRNTE